MKVRLLVDDMDARAKNDGLSALDAHPNIDVRMFNPLPSRSGTMAFVIDFLGDAKRLNHRMHNKTWIADNRIAIVGGRNLGDEYFGADDEVNFVDLDFAMVGPVVRDASASFDRYWNSEVVYPIALLSPETVNPESLEQLRGKLAAAMEEAKKSRYAEALRRDDTLARLVHGDRHVAWTSTYRFVADDPGKATRDPDRSNSLVLAAIVPLLRDAQKDMTIISPYFVPGKEGTANLARSAQAGKGIRILTNSLAANDVAMVYGAYEQYRAKLLESGVQLWELKPLPGSKTTYSMFGSGGSSLHTKGLSVDEADARRRQLQPRRALDAVQQRTGRDSRQPRAGATVHGNLRSAGVRGPFLEGHAVRRAHELDGRREDLRLRARGYGGPEVPGLARRSAADRGAALVPAGTRHDRYSRGVLPVQRRNARVKLLWSVNPSRKATSTRLWRPRRRYSRAISCRVASSSSW